MLGLVRDLRYFVLHAPRQTGKTSALLALRDLLNGGAAGDLHCVYVNVEAAQALREDVTSAMQVIVGEVASRARFSGDGFLYEAWPVIFATFGARALQEALSRWAEDSPKPLVVLIDEIDTLIGDTLVSVLRQLRAGYDQRPERYPQSVVLCGVRDVRDYRIPVEFRRDHHRGERVQHQGGVVAARRLLGNRDAGAAGPAHRRDRPGVLPREPARRCGVRRKVNRGW